MKNVTSTLIAGVLVSGALFANAASAADATDVAKHQLVSAISNSVSQQANEMYYGAKAEILASIQQQLNLSVATHQAPNAATSMMAESAEQNDAESVQTASK
ncbi:hypothetical protein HR45_18680 [Shewanella mangrovi]|uniref:Uncharacterized protein n=1 Tax=Shewanella mangrovi TaxID=1515746 RepID=A0A094J9V6_9GAMM|nr:hypothetical protein [Shewanella mangrovi]KFZ36032.1 hypothetical protein HR45_18680 [Shewanella mangrovi]